VFSSLATKVGSHTIPPTYLIDITSAIYTIGVDASLMDEIADSPLVIAQILDGDSGSSTNTQICSETLTPRSATHTARILLQEPTYFIRPQGYRLDRLERNHNPSSTQTLYVTRYGVPLVGTDI
jgi:hypothetical protein